MSTENITVPVIKNQLSMAIVSKFEKSIQSVLDEAKNLVINENPESVLAVTAFLQKSKAYTDTIEAKRVDLKKPFKEAGDAIDAGAKELRADIDAETNRVKAAYKKVADAVAEKKRLKKIDDERKEGIQAGINNNIMAYSQRIADCETIEQLTKLQSQINLEQGNKAKYQEFLPLWVDRLKSLSPILSLKRKAIQQNKKQGVAIENAIESGNDEAVFELENKREEAEANVKALNIKAMEVAANSYSTETVVADEILPEIRAKRRTVKWVIDDMEKFQKKYPQMCEMQVRVEPLIELIEKLKVDMKSGKLEELNHFGLRLFIEKSY